MLKIFLLNNSIHKSTNNSAYVFFDSLLFLILKNTISKLKSNLYDENSSLYAYSNMIGMIKYTNILRLRDYKDNSINPTQNDVNVYMDDHYNKMYYFE